MTNERAIEIIQTEWKCVDRNDGIHCDRKCENCDLVLDVGEIREAYNMAIKALSAESVSKAVVEQIQWERDTAIQQLNDLGYELGEKQREGDLISRTDLLNAFGLSEETRKYGGDHSGYDTILLYEVQNTIESMPTIPPTEPKKGRWNTVIYEQGGIEDKQCQCNKCFFTSGHAFGYNFCPNCGAEMAEPRKVNE